MLPILLGGSALGYPLLEVQRSAVKIEKEMHMFITRMGILSLGEVGAQSMFDILKQMSDYGELANEVKRIEILVDRWNTSLPEASRIVAQQSPSPLWADFLDRMAFSIEAGQPIDEFMRAEQETIAEQYGYSVRYKIGKRRQHEGNLCVVGQCRIIRFSYCWNPPCFV